MKKKLCDLKEHVYKKRLHFETCAMALAFSLLGSKIALADEVDYNFLTDEDNELFESVTELTRGAGGSLYKLGQTISIVAIVAALMMAGASIAWSRSNPNKKAENKSHVADIILGGAICIGAMGIIGLIVNLASGIKNAGIN